MATEPETNETPPEGDEAPRGRANDRMAAMDRLSSVRADAINAELAESGIEQRVEVEESPTDDDDPPTDVPRNPDGTFAARNPVEDEPQAEPEADEPGELPDQYRKAKVKLKINGQIVERTVDDIIAEGQIDGAARQRLQAATQLLQQAQEEVGRQSETPAITDSPTDDRTPSEPDADRLSKVQAVMDAMYSGDQDVAAKELMDLLDQSGKKPGTQIDVESLKAELRQEIQQQAEKDRQQAAWNRFYDSHPAFAQSEGLRLDLGAELQVVAAANPDATIEEAAAEAAQAIYKRLGMTAPGTENAAPGSTSERADQIRQRKAAAAQQPRGRSVSSANAARPVESSEQARTSTIAQMAAARRGPLPTLPD